MARFSPPLSYLKHLIVLEGILTIWFSALQQPSKIEWFKPLVLQKLCEEISAAIYKPFMPQCGFVLEDVLDAESETRAPQRHLFRVNFRMVAGT